MVSGFDFPFSQPIDSETEKKLPEKSPLTSIEMHHRIEHKDTPVSCIPRFVAVAKNSSIFLNSSISADEIRLAAVREGFCFL